VCVCGVAGKDAEELENHLYRLFKLHDVDNSGDLDSKEFVACMQSLDLGLTISKSIGQMSISILSPPQGFDPVSSPCWL